MTVYPLAVAHDDRRQANWLLWNATPYEGELAVWVTRVAARGLVGPWRRKYPTCSVGVSPEADRRAKGFRLSTFAGRPTVAFNQAYHDARVPHGLWLLGDDPADWENPE